MCLKLKAMYMCLKSKLLGTISTWAGHAMSKLSYAALTVTTEQRTGRDGCEQVVLRLTFNLSQRVTRLAVTRKQSFK